MINYLYDSRFEMYIKEKGGYCGTSISDLISSILAFNITPIIHLLVKIWQMLLAAIA